jgi:hypothetical protein
MNPISQMKETEIVTEAEECSKLCFTVNWSGLRYYLIISIWVFLFSVFNIEEWILITAGSSKTLGISYPTTHPRILQSSYLIRNYYRSCLKFLFYYHIALSEVDWLWTWWLGLSLSMDRDFNLHHRELMGPLNTRFPLGVNLSKLTTHIYPLPKSWKREALHVLPQYAFTARVLVTLHFHHWGAAVCKGDKGRNERVRVVNVRMKWFSSRE